MWPNQQETADLVTFTEEILNGKLPFHAVKIIFLDVVIQIQMKHFQARYVPKKNLPPEMGSQAAGMQWKKSFLSFTKPFSNDIVSSWCLHLIDLLMFFRLFQNITNNRTGNYPFKKNILFF